MSEHVAASAVSSDRIVTTGLTMLLLLATLGEGGGSPQGLLAWHGLLVVLLLVRLCSSPRPGVPLTAWPPGVALGWSLFLVLFVAGLIRAPYKYAGILVALELLACTAVGYLAATRGPSLLRRIVTPLGIVAAIQGGLAVYQAIATESRPAGTFLVPNHLGLWLGAATLLLAGRAIGGTSGERRQAWIFGIPAVAGVVVSGSRGAVFAVAAGGGWLLLVSLGRLDRRRRISVGILAVVVAAALGAGMLTRLRGYDPFRYQRVRIWSASLTGLLSEPWWGTGPGQFEIRAANQKFPDGEGPLRYDRGHRATHSDWLRVPAELGLPAAAVCLVTLVLVVGTVTRRRREATRPSDVEGAIAALIAVGIHAAVDNPSRWPAIYLLASALVGSLIGSTDEARAGDEARSSAGGLGWRLALAASLVIAFAATDVAGFAAWREYAAIPPGRLDDSGLARLERAMRFNRLHPAYPMRLARNLAAAPMDPQDYARARGAAERAVRLQPIDASLRRELARIEAVACINLVQSLACRDRVRLEYEGAEGLARFDPSIPIELALFLMRTGESVGARRAVERALNLEPEAVLPRLILAEIWIEEGTPQGIERAETLLEEARIKAEHWAGWTRTPYGSNLLGLDPNQLERLQRKLRERGAAGLASGAGRSGSTGPPELP